jgi:hypothetical protein
MTNERTAASRALSRALPARTIRLAATECTRRTPHTNRPNDMGPKIEEIDDMPPLEDLDEESTAETGEVRRGLDRSLADRHRRRSSTRKSAPPTRVAHPDDDRLPTLERAGRRRP